MKKSIFLSLSLLSLVLIAGCITVQPPATPVIGTFTNSPSTINAGGTTTLVWDVTGANSVSIDQGIGKVDVSGSRSISPVSTTVYTISATNSNGTVTKSAATTVNAALVPVIGTFTSTNNPSGTSTLMWNVTGANSVSIDQGIGKVDVVGSREISPASSTVYTLSAMNSAGTVTMSAVTGINLAVPANSPVSFAVTRVDVTSEPSTFTGVCPKTFTFTATFTANGPGTATYRWEREDLRYSGIADVTFSAAGTQTATIQWNMSETSAGWIRAHVLTPTDVTSIPVNFSLVCQ